MRTLTLALACLLPLCLTAPAAHAQQDLLVNGSFETGSFSGWNTVTAGNGGFQIGTTAQDAGAHFITPGTGSFSVGPGSGSFYAVSDASDPVNAGPGARALLQTFTVSPGSTHILLDFDMCVNDYNGAGALNIGGALDPTQAAATQYARVDILTGAASALSTNPADILTNLYAGEDLGTPPNAYTHYHTDLSALLHNGGTFQVRFAEVDNQFVLNQGVDNIHLTAVTPEPGAPALLAGIALFGGLIRARLRRK